MEYFATNKAISPETEDIDRLVKWFQTDSSTRIRYMTWREEIDDMRVIAEEAEARAIAAEARVAELEQKLRELGKL